MQKVSNRDRLVRLAASVAMALLLAAFLVWSHFDPQALANQFLARQLTPQPGQDLAVQGQVAALQGAEQEIKDSWLGSPAIWRPPAIASTDIKFFKVTGSTQQELIDSLDNSDLCKRFPPCLKDPANPGGVAWGLEGVNSSGGLCFSPSTATLAFRELIVLPRWSPPADGSVKIPLVEKWNSLAQAIYRHEAGHVAISKRDLAALNHQAHQLATCDAVVKFWANPHVFDKMNSDQNAYHARLRADCRPEIGCIYAGWLGW